METEGHRALKYKLRRKAHSSWLTILISSLIHQIPHYVELLPGTLGSPSHTVPQGLGSSQTCNEGGSPEGQRSSSHVSFAHACLMRKLSHL